MTQPLHTFPSEHEIKTANQYRCPKCGLPLVIKKGRFGGFAGCSGYPDCGYTRSLYLFPKPYCEKCKGKELLPFVKNGKTIPNAFIDCECKDEPEHYVRVRPKDIDYPVSYDYYRSLCQYQGWTAPGPLEPPEPQPAEEPEVWQPKQWDRLKQLEAQVLYIDKKIMELRAERAKRKSKYT